MPKSKFLMSFGIGEEIMTSAVTPASTLNLHEIFRGLTESTDAPQFPNAPYICTNECNRAVTLERIPTLIPTGNVLLGTSCFFNLNAYVKRVKSSQQPYYLIILDSSKNVKDFWNEVVQIVLSSADRDTAHSKIIKLIEKKKNVYYPKFGEDPNNYDVFYINLLQDEINKKQSWLSDEESYLSIKKMMEENRFLFKCVDLFDQAKIESIRTIMNAHNLAIDILYISNLLTEVKKTNSEKVLLKNITTLQNNNFIWLINAEYRSSIIRILDQKIYYLPG